MYQQATPTSAGPPLDGCGLLAFHVWPGGQLLLPGLRVEGLARLGASGAMVPYAVHVSSRWLGAASGNASVAVQDARLLDNDISGERNGLTVCIQSFSMEC